MPKYYDETPKSKTRFCLFWGKSKTGKTYLMGTFPGLYVLDLDQGLNGLPPDKRHIPVDSIGIGQTGSKDINTWKLLINGELKPFTPYDTITGILESIRDGKEPYDKIDVKTIGIDSLTRLSHLFLTEACLDPVIGKSKESPEGRRNPLVQKPTWDEYNAVLYRFKSFFTLLQMIGLSVVCTAEVKYETSRGTGALISADPDLAGSFRTKLMHMFNEVVYMTRKQDVCIANVGTVGLHNACIRNWTGPKSVDNPTYEKLFGGKK